MDSSSEQTTSFFAAIFASKLEAYANGEPAAYIHGQPKVDPSNPNSDTYFQKWLKIGINPSNASNKSESRVEFSRIFDEMEFSPEILELTKDGLNEYDLAEADKDNLANRINYITKESAKVLLNSERNELNEHMKILLQKVDPNAYEKLLEKYTPNDSKLSASEKIAIAKKTLAFDFLIAVRACYMEKITDISNIKYPIVGLDMRVLTLNSISEIQEKLREELSVIKVLSAKGQDKYYIYGRTAENKWELQEIESITVAKVDFTKEGVIPSNLKYVDLYTMIHNLNAHVLSAKDNKQNEENIAKLKTFTEQILLPLEKYKYLPITEETFSEHQIQPQSNTDLLSKAKDKAILVDNEIFILSEYRKNLADKSTAQEIDSALKELRNMRDELQEINEYVLLDMNPAAKLNSLFAKQRPEILDQVIPYTARYVLERMIVKLSRYDQRVLKALEFELDTEDDSPEILEAKATHKKIEEEQIKIIATISDIEKTKQGDNFSQHLDSPIYLIATLQETLDNLNSLSHGLESLQLTREEIKELRGLIATKIKEITPLNTLLSTNPEDISYIKQTHETLDSSIVRVADKFKQTEVEKLQETIGQDLVDMAYIPVTQTQLRMLVEYILKNEKDSFPNVVTTLNDRIIQLEHSSASQLAKDKEGDSLYAIIPEHQKLLAMPSNSMITKRILISKIKTVLRNAESRICEINTISKVNDNLTLLRDFSRTCSGIDKLAINKLIDRALQKIVENDYNLDDEIYKISALCETLHDEQTTPESKEQISATLKKMLINIVQEVQTSSSAAKAKPVNPANEVSKAFSTLFKSINKTLDPTNQKQNQDKEKDDIHRPKDGM
ncbi:MAG: hypothetical protein P1U74_09520 [Legionellaceae bacterium]|nr:hypothetical protein [Legionellaceae bacterium]